MQGLGKGESRCACSHPPYVHWGCLRDSNLHPPWPGNKLLICYCCTIIFPTSPPYLNLTTNTIILPPPASHHHSHRRHHHPSLPINHPTTTTMTTKPQPVTRLSTASTTVASANNLHLQIDLLPNFIKRGKTVETIFNKYRSVVVNEVRR